LKNISALNIRLICDELNTGVQWIYGLILEWAFCMSVILGTSIMN
jgi:hypothetical protein